MWNVQLGVIVYTCCGMMHGRLELCTQSVQVIRVVEREKQADREEANVSLEVTL